ncbi:hypothetical protein SAMN02745136_02976 [Anaerocolumna jejuensis DSM 15929]|uniref:Lipoprotein n=1 Tax=Anaerocolumna jejuensis DSM 15929 TaxID=1121322 RepID=A0A1M6U3D7_9FIRM|nr:hypothetical protein SAMN02745136_02976 [Anaerocolumna jejuensis DSM 15929]
MYKISLIFSGILFLLGCMTLGAAIFCSDVLPRIFKIYLLSHPTNYSDDMLYINSTRIYLLAFAEIILGIFSYFYHLKKTK